MGLTQYSIDGFSYLCGMCLSFAQVLDPLLTIYFISDYKLFLLRKRIEVGFLIEVKGVVVVMQDSGTLNTVPLLFISAAELFWNMSSLSSYFQFGRFRTFSENVQLKGIEYCCKYL